VFEHERSKLALPLRPLTRWGQDQESTGASSEGARPKRIGEKKNGDKQSHPFRLPHRDVGRRAHRGWGTNPPDRDYANGDGSLAAMRLHRRELLASAIMHYVMSVLAVGFVAAMVLGLV
jgi:hypothetical protein